MDRREYDFCIQWYREITHFTCQKAWENTRCQKPGKPKGERPWLPPVRTSTEPNACFEGPGPPAPVREHGPPPNGQNVSGATCLERTMIATIENHHGSRRMLSRAWPSRPIYEHICMQYRKGYDSWIEWYRELDIVHWRNPRQRDRRLFNNHRMHQ